MGTYCAPLVADLFLFCYERDFMLSLSEDNQSGVIEAFNSTSRYLDDLLNIDNNFFDSMVNRVYPSELQLNKSRKETPQKLTQLSSRSHPRYLVGKRTAQKDITIDTTSDSQVNSNFPNRWSPASLTFNNYFYLFLYLYITLITTNNNANVSDSEASFLDLHLSISDGFVKTKIYDKRENFDFDIVHFPFLDGDVPRSASYGVYISQLIRFARVSSHVDDFNTRNKVL